MRPNLHERTVAGFGREWSRYDQSALSPGELQAHFDAYFGIFPWQQLPPAPVGFDLGCGSGRWAKLVAPRVHELHCVDASWEALAVAGRNLAGVSNCKLHEASVDSLPFPDGTMDFGYSLGVLHHLPDPQAGLRACVKKLRMGAPFLVYLYYAFDNQPAWYRQLWRVSELGRKAISRLPDAAKALATSTLAASIYWPLARLAWLIDKAGLPVQAFPLSMYRNASFYTMKTDALDRFGTVLEHRFTRAQIQTMMAESGLDDLRFSDAGPFWCAVGRRVQ